MTNYMKSAIRENFSDGSSHNPNIGTVTFALTLPTELGASLMVAKSSPSPKPVLNCLARAMETSKNPLVSSAIRSLFDWIYERSTPEEREGFPNWFDSQ